MSTGNPGKSPVQRLEGLDIARFLAFAGMVIVNFRIVMGTVNGGDFSKILNVALEGRAAATFVVLAGIGLGLSAAKGMSGTIMVTVKRAIFLLVLGLLNMLVFDADILHFYAFYFLIGVMLLSTSNRFLIMIIVGLNLAFIVMALTLNYESGWNWENFTYKDFWTPAGFIRNLFFNGWHPIIPWLAFLLFGIILARLQLDEKLTQNKLILFGIASFAAAEILSLVLTPLLTGLDAELASLTTTSPIPPMPLYVLAGLGASSAVIGLCLRFSDFLKRTGVLAILAPAGRQTLTLYIAHILLGMGTLEVLGLRSNQSLETALLAALVFCLLSIAFALIWKRFFKRGPIEGLMRVVAG